VERRSLAERYDQLERRRDELTVAEAQPSAVHVQTVKVLKDLLTMGKMFSTGRVPAPLRAMMRMLDRLEPELVKELAGVPPEAIREFLSDLMHRIGTIIEVPVEEQHGTPTVDHGAPPVVGADQSSTA
jgi:hypothetical protein